jgi:uncharacterized protein YbaR (Trm112 family)
MRRLKNKIMHIKTISKLCCPFDHADLDLTVVTKDVTGEEIMEGFFVCQKCERIYPIISGIPIMSPDQDREGKLEKPIIDRWAKQLKGKSVSNFRLVEANEDNLTLADGK